jgi:hypothetical protein
VELWATREARALDNEHKRAEIESLKIRNARELVGIASDVERLTPEGRALVRHLASKQDLFAELAEDGKLTGVRLLDSESEGPRQ